jgi:hypothetical protein
VCQRLESDVVANEQFTRVSCVILGVYLNECRAQLIDSLVHEFQALLSMHACTARDDGM